MEDKILNNSNYTQILNHIVGITENRDVEILELSLIKTIFEVIPCDCVCMIKSETDYMDFNSTLYYDVSGYNSSVLPDKFDKEILESGLKQAFTTGKIKEIKNKGFIYVISPVTVLKKNIGFIVIKTLHYNDHEPLVFNSLIRIYQNYVSVIIDNQRDTLTGLLNRKTFDDRIMKLVELKKSEKSHNGQDRERRKLAMERFWLGIFDIDHFKRINDTYGHVFGDEILILISRLMQEHFRNNDLIFRYGGEEFIAVTRADGHDVFLLYERFRKIVESYNFPQVGKITVSIGVVEITGHDIPTSFVGFADRALYYAKENGRNMTCMYSDLVARGLIPSEMREGRVLFFDD